MDGNVSGADFQALSRALKAAGEGKGKDSLRGQMLAELRAIAKPIQSDLRAAILAVDSKAQAHSSARRAAAALSRTKNVDEKKASRALGRSGLRESIARSLRISVTDSGVRITTTGATLPKDQRGLPRALNKPQGWRHPVFGDKDTWVQQYGNPPGWFFSTAEAHKPMAAKRVERVVRDYVARLAARINDAA